jgi:hypothetical protein
MTKTNNQNNLEAEYAERARREAQFEQDYGGTGEGSAYHMTVAQVVELEKQYGLYCGICQHGNGCEHGVPASRS